MSDRFARLLRQRIGLDAEAIGGALVARAVRLRSARVSGGDIQAYWELLQASENEQQALVDAVVVPETWFFRYPESFAVLARHAARRAAELKGARPLRLLSVPCSSGEEPCSLVMALLDAGLPAGAFHVDALDVSPALLERAEAGLYRRNSFRGEQLGFRERHFTRCGQDYRISAAVRDKVRFRSGNLLEPAFLAGESAYDYVFCRNLLIYFDRATQTRAVQLIRRLTREDGLLFIGPAEACLLHGEPLRALGVEQAFAFRHPPREELRKPAGGVPPPRLGMPQRPALPVPVPVAVLPVLAPMAGDAGELAEIAELADRGLLREARQRCDAHLAAHGPSAEVFYWQGLLCDAEGRPGEAQGCYRKALYLQPDHQHALLQLAALLAAQGNGEAARRLQARAARGVSANA